MEAGQISILMDGKKLLAKEGQTIVQAAKENGVFIPTLCDFKSLHPAGTCRVCLVKVGEKILPACSTKVSSGMQIENSSGLIEGLRKALIEMLMVEGHHLCPSCEKSGDCELQALAYHYRIDVNRFPHSFHHRKIDASLPHLIIEHSRCIQCQRCIRGVKSKDGHDLFGFVDRGSEIQVSMDPCDPESQSPEVAAKAQKICPVGALIKKGGAYQTPIGERQFDKHELGSDLEKSK